MEIALEEKMMHRHNEYVDHVGLDHTHGPCSEHAHWAGGSHGAGTPLEVSTPENDPLGWPEMTEEEAQNRALWAKVGRLNDRETIARAAAGLEAIGQPGWAQAMRNGHESGRRA